MAMPEIERFTLEKPITPTPFNGDGLLSYYLATHNNSANLLPAWGMATRLYQQRRLWYAENNTLVVGALVGLKKLIQQTPWELVGAKNQTKKWQDILQNCQYGQGWDAFLSRALQDYMTLDCGTFIEIVGRGDPSTPLRGDVVGLNVLDGLRCYPTGNPEYPIFYMPYNQQFPDIQRMTDNVGIVKVHWTRVVRMVDTPSPDPYFRGLGLSMMSRAAAVANMSGLLVDYQVNQMSEVPPNGIVVWGGLIKSHVDKSKEDYEGQKQAGQTTILRNHLEIFGADPEHEPKVTITPFATVPESFNLTETMQTYVNLLANAIGVDPQDIFPLANSAMGSGAQSTVLHRKGQGKAYGQLLTEIERIMNLLLPRSLEFKFKPRDTERDKADADNATQWASVATILLQSGVIDREAAALLLANNVGAFNDLLLDDAGVLRLPDDDPKADNAPDVSEVVADDSAEIETEQSTDNQTVTDDTKALGDKAIGATQSDFERDMRNLFIAAVAGDVNRRRFGVAARALIARYGRRAYLDGLATGNIGQDDMTPDDMSAIERLIGQQSVYVTNVGEAIYIDNVVTELEAEGKPRLWFNKSIMPFFQAGQFSADRNGIYEWQLGATEQHCKDCQRLNGQVHRLSNWSKRGWLPQANKLACGGFNCDCRLVKTTKQVNGSY